MIDKLVLHIPFKSAHVFLDTMDRRHSVNLQDIADEIDLCGRCVEFVDGVAVASFVSTMYESLPSSMSGMAFKVFNETVDQMPYVEIKCSPAKLTQGHNLYGFDDIQFSAKNMLWLLGSFKPDLFEMLDTWNATVSEFDITYSAFIADKKTRFALIEYLASVSYGQTKSRGDAFQTTCYFGAKNSRLKKLKVYLKEPEMENDYKSLISKELELSANIVQELLKTDRAKQSVRFEATAKRRYLERRCIPTNLFGLIAYIKKSPSFYADIFGELWGDVFKALEGDSMRVISDKAILDKLVVAYSTQTATGAIRKTTANRLFAFYGMLKNMGYKQLQASGMYSRSAFARNIKNFVDIGFSRAFLQNLNTDTGAQVFQIAKIIKIDFNNQQPTDYQYPVGLWAA